MSEDLLVNITPQETRVALIQQGAVQELHIERTASRGRAGNIYLGKVVRVLPGMQSAFIDIGQSVLLSYMLPISGIRVPKQAPAVLQLRLKRFYSMVNPCWCKW